MKPEEALSELLARLGAGRGEPILISEQELSDWPAQAVEASKSHKLLVKARPASSVICPGCELACVMLVHTLTHRTLGSESFIVCDKRDDINRVRVPTGLREQWQGSGLAIADLLARLLGLHRPDSSETICGRWEVGVLKGKRGSSHLVLLAEGKMRLTLAGHSIVLDDILDLTDHGFKVNKQALIHCVNHPIGGAGDMESAMQRRARLTKRIRAEKATGKRGFLKTVAQEEGISVSRLKQILQPRTRAK